MQWEKCRNTQFLCIYFIPFTYYRAYWPRARTLESGCKGINLGLSFAMYPSQSLSSLVLFQNHTGFLMGIIMMMANNISDTVSPQNKVLQSLQP